MLTILVINSKGGSGKTTLTTNLAAYYANRGFRTAIIDYDPQSSSLHWLQARPATLPAIHAANGAPARGNAHLSSRQGWVPLDTEVLVVDAPAGLVGVQDGTGAGLGGNLEISTAPDAPPTHWEQLYFPLSEPIPAKAGERVLLSLRTRSSEETGTHLAWTAVHSDAAGKTIPAWHIQDVTAQHNGKTVMTAQKTKSRLKSTSSMGSQRMAWKQQWEGHNDGHTPTLNLVVEPRPGKMQQRNAEVELDTARVRRRHPDQFLRADRQPSQR